LSNPRSSAASALLPFPAPPKWMLSFALGLGKRTSPVTRHGLPPRSSTRKGPLFFDGSYSFDASTAAPDTESVTWAGARLPSIGLMASGCASAWARTAHANTQHAASDNILIERNARANRGRIGRTSVNPGGRGGAGTRLDWP